MELETNGTTARLKIDGTFTVTELEALMRKLALLRAGMTPEVVEQRDDLLAPGVADALLVEDRSAMVIAQHADGAFRLFCRHRGYGWLVYKCEAMRAAAIAGFIAERVDTQTPNLFADQIQKPHH